MAFSLNLLRSVTLDAAHYYIIFFSVPLAPNVNLLELISSHYVLVLEVQQGTINFTSFCL